MITIAKKEQCSGCSACAAACPKQCIAMVEDIEGFKYPEVDISMCIDCGLCNKVCPVPTGIRTNNEPTAYAAINLNEHVREKSSSGGVFYLLAKQIIDNGGVVVGARFDKNFNVEHSCAKTLEDVEAFMSSKYTQSTMGDTYRRVKECLLEGKTVLFTGTPCQVGGLKSFLNKDYDGLICQDLVCHGVPSPKVWRNYLNYHEKKAHAQVERVSFRDKTHGWKSFQMALGFSNGTVYEETHATDMFMKGFLMDFCLRPSCYHCAFKSKSRDADITLADFWGIRKAAPEMDDDRGTSLVFIHSKKGSDLLKAISQNLMLTEVDAENVIQYNPAMIRSAGEKSARSSFIAETQKRPFDKVVKKYCEPKEKWITCIKRKVKVCLIRMLDSVKKKP